MIGAVPVLMPPALPLMKPIVFAFMVLLKLLMTNVDAPAAALTADTGWVTLSNVAPRVLSSLKLSAARFVTAWSKAMDTSALVGGLMNFTEVVPVAPAAEPVTEIV